MSDDSPDEDGFRGDVPTGRESPVGQPVVRADPDVTGDHAADAVAFDPDDPDSLAAAAETVREFTDDAGGDNVYVLRGAAACAALVRGEGSYRAAAARAGGPVTVEFLRKWARVHDLPRSVRRHVAVGDIAPSAAKHVARLSGTDRLHLAWAIIDHDLTVREVRAVASAVVDGADLAAALADHGATLGELRLVLPTDLYCELRREASLSGVDPGEIVADALDGWFE